MNAERRKHRRSNINSTGDITYYKQVKMKDQAAVVDISEGGVSFLSPIMLSPGDKIVFNLHNNDLNFEGRVTRSEANGNLHKHGIAFDNISDHEKNRLMEQIAEMRNKYCSFPTSRQPKHIIEF
ncbi:MAG: PilZ domain-containing protein [Elusimicrobiota bacterium]